MEDMLSAGHIAGDYLYIDQPNYIRLLRKYRSDNDKDMNFPPVPQLAKNAGQAMGRIASALLRGEKILVSEAEVARRREICKTCEFFKNGRCLKCGCFNKYKNKLKTEKCPIGKW